LLLTAACGGSKKDNKTAKSDASTSTTETTVAGETTTTAAGGSTTTAKKGSATTAKGSGTTSKPTQAGGAPAPATPGTYDYSQSGTSSLGTVPPNGTLVVDKANSSGVQVWHRATDPSQPTSDTTIAFRSDGPFITDSVQRASGQTVTCHFDKPVPAPPFPATDGKPISGHANCGQITVDVSGSITGHRTTQLDGQTIEVVVATVTLTTHGQVESTATQTEWWSPALRLTVHSESKVDGRFGAFPFSSNVTSDLKSGQPR